jgi:hypothetical protein
MEAYPKPRHQYIYNPRYGQRGVLTYAGQTPNGAPPTGVIPNGGVGYGYGYGAVGMGLGMGVGMGTGVGVAAGGYYPGVQSTRSYYPYHSQYSYYGGGASYYSGASSYYPGVSSYYPTAYSGYHNYGLYGSLYPLANFYYPYQRSYYNTVPSYGYAQQAYVYPPGPSATTTTTTYHVTNSHAGAGAYRRDCIPSAPAPVGPTREDYQMENRRVATERGAYDLRRIKPADARSDDPFWCRERNGEWHLRTFYQIENECHPGTWKMDAEMGYLVFHRE